MPVNNIDSEMTIAKTFENMLIAIGKGIESQFHVNAAKVAPDEHGHISETTRPIMKAAKTKLKELLTESFDADQLSSLCSMCNERFLKEISASASDKDKSSIGLAVQLLMNIGIPLLKNVIGQAAKHKKHEEHKQHPAGQHIKPSVYHPSADHASGSAAKHHGQVAQDVTVGYHRMTSGNRGSK